MCSPDGKSHANQGRINSALLTIFRFKEDAIYDASVPNDNDKRMHAM